MSAANMIAKFYRSFRRVTFPPSVADIEWRHESLSTRLDNLERLITNRFPLTLAATPEKQSGVLEALRLLRPERVVGYRKIRVGSGGDGGYVQIDDLANISRALSFGVSDDDSWDFAMATKGIPVEQFDHSIEAAPSTHPLLTFHRKMIAPETTEHTASLPDLVKRQSRLEAPDLILKMDIEGGEWDVFDAASESDLSKLAQIICEFHDLSKLDQPDFQARAHRVFAKLRKLFAPVHVHGNNCGALCNIANVPVPDIIEITFVNRSRYALEESDEIFPTPLDAPNDARLADVILGSFRF